MAPKVALVTGVCGQDGSYLVELLLEKGYIVHGGCAAAARSKGGWARAFSLLPQPDAPARVRAPAASRANSHGSTYCLTSCPVLRLAACSPRKQA